MAQSDQPAKEISSDWIDSTSLSLVQRVKEDDSQAWERLVRLYSPLVVSWCRTANLSNEDIGDVIQEVFRSLHGAIGRFQHERPGGTFRGWLRKITANKVNDLFQKQKKSPQAEGGTEPMRRWQQVADPFADNLDEEVQRTESSIVFHRGLELVRSEFEDKTWNAFWRVTIDGCVPDDVAQELGMSRFAVYKAKSRVLKRLRKELGEPEE